MSDRKAVRTERAPAPGGVYSQAIAAGDFVFCAGQLGVDPATGKLVEGGIGEQVERAMLNLQAVLEEAGSGLDRLVKTTVFLADIGDLAALNEAYARHAGDVPPARSTFQVAALPAPGALVEIEAIAAR